MSQPELRRRMRGNDAMFLYLEKKDLPLHIGAVAILDGPFDEASEQLLAARLPEIPRYRQRVVFSPMNVSHPCWEDDPDFDITNHIRRVRLEPPGNEAQLSALSGEVFTPLMDRGRPLWDLTVVDGLEGGRSALIFRVHHCMVDGVSGIGLVNSIFDPTRQPRVVEPRPYDPPPLPDPRQVMVEGLSNIWAEAAERLIGTQLTVLRIAQSFLGDSAKDSLRALLATAPELMKPTERLPFNGPCSGVRGHCWAAFPFGEARGIRSALGGTINDVVLTTVTGAFTRYVAAHREPVKNRFVRMMVPVNLRTEDPRGTVGNDISMLPLSVPLDIDDPVERLRVVTLRSSAMKAARVADVVQLIGTQFGWLPTKVQQSLGSLPFMPHPVMIVNTVCTNVPGPMVPLYVNGRQVLTYYPHVPCGSNVGLAVAIASYNGNLYYGVTYDMQAAPDGELFRDFLIESYDELRAAAGVPKSSASFSSRGASAPPSNLRSKTAADEAKVTSEPPVPVPAPIEASTPVPQPVAEATPEPAAHPTLPESAAPLVQPEPPPPISEPSIEAAPIQAEAASELIAPVPLERVSDSPRSDAETPGELKLTPQGALKLPAKPPASKVNGDDHRTKARHKGPARTKTLVAKT